MLVRGVRVAMALFPVGVALATTPLVLTGVERDLLVAGACGAAICGLSVLAAIGGRRGSILALAALALGAGWIAAVVTAPELFAVADAGRVPVALGATLLVAATTIDRRRIVAALASPGAPSAFDIVYLPGVVAVVFAATTILDWAPLLSGAVLVGAVLGYPWSRRLAGAAFEQLVIGNVRRRAETKAIEEERGRLAREIHDVPMQDLSAVIRRLESLPGSEAEVDALRNVMGQLRDVATSLHPPVLQDLGLAAALVDLGDALRAAVPGRDIRVDVDDLSGVGGRPPEEVESAAFRVVQEAVANALKHSGGTTVSIAGSVANEVIDLAVADSGAGLDRQQAAAARRNGHFGLDSMRERATLVGGVTTIDSSPSGVVVRFVWERGT